MTLVSEIMTDAYRLSNLIAVGTEPTANEKAEALRYLQRIVSSVLGNEVGDPLTYFPLGTANRTRPNGYPAWGQDPGADWFVPRNSRLSLNLDSPTTVYLHPAPHDGTRFAISDAAQSLDTAPLTINGNGFFIEGATDLVLNTAGLNREWIFRADLGSWVAVSPLVETDAFPFPVEFDDFFVAMLAMRLNPSYGLTLDGQGSSILTRYRNQLRARYKQVQFISPEPGTYRLSRTSRDHYWASGLYQPAFGDIPSLRFRR